MIVTDSANARVWPDFGDTGLPKVTLASLSQRVFALGRGERLTLIGIDRDAVGEALRADPLGTRCALLLATEGAHTSDAIVGRLLDDLADLALDRWPRWFGSDAQNQDDLLRNAIADRLVSAPWLKAAVKRAGAGHPPRFRKATTSLELTQLLRAIDPAGLVMIAALDPASPARAAPVIQVLEWCAAHGAAVVAAFPTQPPPVTPYDRVLYGALDVVRDVKPARSRFIAPPSKAHHASPTEERVEAALRADAELGPLFTCNETVAVQGFGAPPRVDLLWKEGRVVVELDGADHQGDPKFANDRHRDYQLLVAGYLVLRITNDQVDTDLQHAVEKIRAVVRFRRSWKKG